MKPAEIHDLARGIANMLLSHAAHGLSTGALLGMGEITLRDGLVVAAAAAGARSKQAWLLRREVTPIGWTDAPVDLMIYRKGQQDTEKVVGGIELKFWRRQDAANAANRRRDLVKDFIRAAALYTQTEDFAFVALLSTNVSWDSTVDTSGKDKEVMNMLDGKGTQKWNLEKLASSSAVKAAVVALENRVPTPNILHSELLVSFSIQEGDIKSAFSKVWLIKKPQRSKIIDDISIKIFKKKKAKQKAEPTAIAVTPPAIQEVGSTAVTAHH